MNVAQRLVLIALGYVLAVAGGLAAVAVNELLMPADVAQGSPGMVAFGDMILLVLITGFLSLLPTWFLLKLAIEKAPRVLVAALLLAAVMGPLSWLAVIGLAGGLPANQPGAIYQLFGPLIALVAIPRMVAGPVLLLIELVAVFLVRWPAARALLATAMLMDIVPLSLFALHMARGIVR
jgi:hypothetical protein